MQERSYLAKGAKQELPLGEGSDATEPYNKYVNFFKKKQVSYILAVTARKASNSNSAVEDLFCKLGCMNRHRFGTPVFINQLLKISFNTVSLIRFSEKKNSRRFLVGAFLEKRVDYSHGFSSVFFLKTT